jgi:hypothetical protein
LWGGKENRLCKRDTLATSGDEVLGGKRKNRWCKKDALATLSNEFVGGKRKNRSRKVYALATLDKVENDLWEGRNEFILAKGIHSLHLRRSRVAYWRMFVWSYMMIAPL